MFRRTVRLLTSPPTLGHTLAFGRMAVGCLASSAPEHGRRHRRALIVIRTLKESRSPAPVASPSVF